VQQVTAAPSGTTILPAPYGDSPAATQQSVISQLHPGGQVDAAGNPVDPTVLYGLVTDTEYGHMNADGSVTPYFVNYPVWIVEYQGVVLMSSGGAPNPLIPGSPPTTTPPPPPVETGTSMTFYDAQTGAYLFGVSWGGP
jgi:hypothetical protein